MTAWYDLVVKFTTRERRFKHELLRQAALSSGMEVLDPACGTGTLAIWAKQGWLGINVVGIDGDTKILGIASAKAARAGVSIQLDHGFSTTLPDDDARLDRALSSLFFHHLSLESKRRILTEVLRVLKPGGQ